jgi:hypothetical protein
MDATRAPAYVLFRGPSRAGVTSNSERLKSRARNLLQRRRIPDESSEPMICSSCNTPHENVRGKCPHCGSDFHGHIGDKHAVKPHDVELRSELLWASGSYRCPHKILRHQPCPECAPTNEECEVYRRSILYQLKTLFIDAGVDKSEAWERAKTFLAKLDAADARDGV